MPGWLFHELAECAAVAVLAFAVLAAVAFVLKAERAAWTAEPDAAPRANP